MIRTGIGIGSNLNNPLMQCQKALEALKQLAETEVMACSSFYRNEPLLPPRKENLESVDWYVNAVCLVETKLLPDALLDELLAIEKKMGRIRRIKWESRLIDLDLLFYGPLVLKNEGLTLPHPEMHKRSFVLDPLYEICPEWVHPVSGQSVKQMLDQLNN